MKINKTKLANPKIIAGILTIAILSLIIFAGPAKAFILGLTIDGDSEVEQGKKIIFNATLEIQSVDKYLPVKELRLVIDGPETRICRFDITGKKIGNESGCHGINIKKIPLPQIEKGYGYSYGYDNSYGYGYGYDFGYGYGYSEQTLSYEITIHTQHFLSGNYESQLKALIGDKTFESKDKPKFTIKDKEDDDDGGSNGNLGYCGDGFCDSDETSETCPGDCPLKIELLGTSNNILNLTSGEPENNRTQKNNFTDSLTGAVTGITEFAKSRTGMIAFVILMGIFAALIIFLKRLSKRLKK